MKIVCVSKVDLKSEETEDGNEEGEKYQQPSGNDWSESKRM